MGIITRIISHIYSITIHLQDRLRLTAMGILSLSILIFMLLKFIMRALLLFIIRNKLQQDIYLQNIRLFTHLPQMFTRLRDEYLMFSLLG